MANAKQIQQGDVLFAKVDKLPVGCVAVVRQRGDLVIAEGESTGHRHIIMDKTATLWELRGDLYLEVTDPVVLTHDEHKELPIPVGVYKVGIVQEYDHFNDVIRDVRD